MPWHILNARDRELVVCGESAGVPTYTRTARDALEFQNPDAARHWIAERVVSEFGSLVLLRVDDKSPSPRRPSHYTRRIA